MPLAFQNSRNAFGSISEHLHPSKPESITSSFQKQEMHVRCGQDVDLTAMVSYFSLRAVSALLADLLRSLMDCKPSVSPPRVQTTKHAHHLSCRLGEVRTPTDTNRSTVFHRCDTTPQSPYLSWHLIRKLRMLWRKQSHLRNEHTG